MSCFDMSSFDAALSDIIKENKRKTRKGKPRRIQEKKKSAKKPAARVVPKVTPRPTKLNIRNLFYGVSDADIEELFGEFGSYESSAVHFDRAGRSKGAAHVIYGKKSDALKALKSYNGVKLDGRKLKISVAPARFSSKNKKPKFVRCLEKQLDQKCDDAYKAARI